MDIEFLIIIKNWPQRNLQMTNVLLVEKQLSHSANPKNYRCSSSTLDIDRKIKWLKMGICEAIHTRVHQQNNYIFLHSCLFFWIEVQCDSYPGKVEPQHNETLLIYYKELCIMILRPSYSKRHGTFCHMIFPVSWHIKVPL